ncbi:MAG: hypothetical protein JSV92_00275 [archaeon]|nr:MAG: hypothetical protein JSV92_00275 [archaeon]
MNSKIFLVIGIVLVIAGASLFVFRSIGDRKATVTGQFLAREDCTGVVQGTLITDYGGSGDMCDEAEKYDGRVLEVTGRVYELECTGGEQCFGGPHMRNVESIEIMG